MDEDRFSIWLSMAGRDPSIRRRIQPALGRAGYQSRLGSRPHFSGVRIGRGAGVGRVLAATHRQRGGDRRRVAIATRVIRLWQGGDSVRHHLRYLVRSSEDQERRLKLYGPTSEPPVARAFNRACHADRHQFRLIVAPDDACEYADLQPLVRRLMKQVACDLRTDLDWVAVDHYDTANAHAHIVIRGLDDRGNDLIIAREYMRHGFQARTAELVALDLGPADLDANPARGRLLDIQRERVTAIDHDLVAACGADHRVSLDGAGRWEQIARAGRLRVLKTLGLARPHRDGSWYLSPDVIEQLDEIAWRNQIGWDRASRRTNELGISCHEGSNPGETGPAKWRTDRLGPTAMSPVFETDPYFQHLGTNHATCNEAPRKVDHSPERELSWPTYDNESRERHRWNPLADLVGSLDRPPRLNFKKDQAVIGRLVPDASHRLEGDNGILSGDRR